MGNQIHFTASTDMSDFIYKAPVHNLRCPI